MSQTRQWRPQEASAAACCTHLGESHLQVSALHLTLLLWKGAIGLQRSTRKTPHLQHTQHGSAEPATPDHRALTEVTAENQKDNFLATFICMTSKAKFPIIQRTEISWQICLATQFPSGNSYFSPGQHGEGAPRQDGRKRFFSAREQGGIAALPVR